MNKIIISIGMILALNAVFLKARAQPINLDNPVKAGELTVFPDIGNANNYYYLSDKPRLAKDANGKYQFLFFKVCRKCYSRRRSAGQHRGRGRWYCARLW
jgi:hypothetical protein